MTRESCYNCVAEHVGVNKEPCKSCRDKSNWTAAAGVKASDNLDCIADESKPDKVNHPEHYNFGKHECIEEMERLFGPEAVLHWCMCNVYKYRYRATHKNGAEDLKKADWYMDKVIEMQKEAARL